MSVMDKYHHDSYPGDEQAANRRQIKLVLAAVLREHQLDLQEDRPVKSVRRNVTMGPKTGVRMRVVRRRG